MNTQGSYMETRRLIIRPITKDDLEKIYGLIFSDPESQERISIKSYSLEEMKAHFASRHIDRSDGFGYRIVENKKTNDMIGLIGFKPYAGKFDHSFELGRDTGFDPLETELRQAELIYIFPRAYRGKGYTVEAARAMIAYGFQDLDLNRIVKPVHRRNLATVLSMRRLGFRIAAITRPQSKNKETQSDLIGMLECVRVILDKEFTRI